MIKATVVCNLCGWKKAEENVPDWHNKPCPDCKTGVIINDEELQMWKVVNATSEFSDKILEINPETPTVRLHLNSAPIREGKPMKVEVV